jgi:hypothetical protein
MLSFDPPAQLKDKDDESERVDGVDPYAELRIIRLNARSERGDDYDYRNEDVERDAVHDHQVESIPRRFAW